APGTVFYSGTFPTAEMTSAVRKISRICPAWSGFGCTWRVGFTESLMDAPPSMPQADKHVYVIASSSISLLKMATTSIPHRWNYDGFVSFRGDDIRKSFMDHVFNDFKQKGIHAFRDDRELPKGEKIFSHLYKAIEELRFLIVIFSKDYASWCLRELVKILECKLNESPKHEVRIIFYDAKPDVVRKQKRSYAEAFSKHEISNSTKVGKWKEALSMAADFSRCQDMTNR
ncbi:NB-ARC domains-containing protein, partial [Tanacetum coccineum]